MKRFSRQVKIGDRVIGGGAPILVQSMLNAPADDFNKNLEQLTALQDAGCEIVRMAIPDAKAATVLGKLKEYAKVPLVADIHFDYKLALESLEAGVDKIRISPGNIGSFDRVEKVANACAAKKVPIRIGVNSGSVEKDLLAKYGGATPDYPLHLGVTEAGTERSALIKSSIGIGSLLLNGIGDTIRVSVTDTPVKEVYAGFDILKALNMRVETPQIVSCPTCGRTKIDLVKLAGEVENAVRDIHKPIKIAVMGCAVNGPGEAREADIGVAGGDGCGIIFKNGEILRKVEEKDIVSELLKEIEKI